MTEIEKLRELEAKATPGPWQFYELQGNDGLGYIRPKNEDYLEIAHHGDSGRPYEENAANAALICEARNALPSIFALLASNAAEIERLRRCLKERPNTLVIAHEDGDHQRLARAACRATDRAEAADARTVSLEAQVARLREALEQITRIDTHEGGMTSEDTYTYLGDFGKIARSALEKDNCNG